MTINKHLGKKSEYIINYDPDILVSIPRKIKRNEIGIDDKKLPFNGVDIWNAYELSWLNLNGKPQIALGEIYLDAKSENIIESKSMKLYFNSFNGTKFSSTNEVESIIEEDLKSATKGDVKIQLFSENEYYKKRIEKFNGKSLDSLDIKCDIYTVHPNFLTTDDEIIENEILYSNLLKSNCLVTYQPDWGSVKIEYSGKKINEEGLLKYIVSFRNHNEFHEQCVERIYKDIMEKCSPVSLNVYARYTRRGGLDINPFRTSEEKFNVKNIKLFRQ